MTALTASALITMGYRDAGKLAYSASLSAGQLSEGLDRLNDIINLWQTQGLKLFLETETTVTLVAGQQSYSFMPSGDVDMARPLEVKQASYWDSNGVSRPLVMISRQEWTYLTNRTEEGSVNQFFVEKLYDRLNLHLWSIPDTTAATGTVRVVLRNQATNPAVVGDSTRFPPEWAIALRWALADEVATGMPEAIVQRCSSRAEAFRQALENWDVEQAETYFQPDPRMQTQSASRFR